MRHWRRTCSIGCAEAEIDPQRQRGDELGESHPRPIEIADHAGTTLTSLLMGDRTTRS